MLSLGLAGVASLRNVSLDHGQFVLVGWLVSVVMCRLVCLRVITLLTPIKLLLDTCSAVIEMGNTFIYLIFSLIDNLYAIIIMLRLPGVHCVQSRQVLLLHLL